MFQIARRNRGFTKLGTIGYPLEDVAELIKLGVCVGGRELQAGARCVGSPFAKLHSAHLLSRQVGG